MNFTWQYSPIDFNTFWALNPPISPPTEIIPAGILRTAEFYSPLESQSYAFFNAAEGALLFYGTAKSIPCALATWFINLSTDYGIPSASISSLKIGKLEISAHSNSMWGLFNSTHALKSPVFVEALRREPEIKTTLSF